LGGGRGHSHNEQISPIVLRGITTAGVNLGIVIGQLLSNAAIKGFGDRNDHWAYRGPFAIQFFFVGMFRTKRCSFVRAWEILKS
jgi:hypothetical protein